jgi:DNA-binding LytR/AlgR family response regulator
LNERLSAKDFTFYGFVAFSISIALNGIHIIRYLLKLIKYKDQFRLNKKVRETFGGQTGTMAVAMGNRTLMMEPDSIGWWHSSGGAVTLVRTDGVQFTTNYTTFSEITDRLPESVFFHLNRQVIANRTSIDSIQNGQNGQLIVQLKTLDLALTVAVSRYKRDAFRHWMEGARHQ